jgi:hypothetical protein
MIADCSESILAVAPGAWRVGLACRCWLVLDGDAKVPAPQTDADDGGGWPG